jgi:hypothetical protein
MDSVQKHNICIIHNTLYGIFKSEVRPSVTSRAMLQRTRGETCHGNKFVTVTVLIHSLRTVLSRLDFCSVFTSTGFFTSAWVLWDLWSSSNSVAV